MTIDESDLTAALHGIATQPPPDLASRARRGGRRRLLRNRSLVAAGVVAVGGAAVPTYAAVRSTGSSIGQLHAASSGDSLYATPPAADQQCNGGFSARSSDAGHDLAAAYRDLLLLPSGQIDSAYVREERANCTPPHVALTATTGNGNTIDQGLVVEGPNAPTSVEAGQAGANVDFFGDTGHQSIDGQSATEFTLSQGITTTRAFWTEPDGGQWEASVRGMSQGDAVALLDHLQLDSDAGTATFTGSSGDGWTIAPPAADKPNPSGFVISQWTDPQGSRVDMTVTQSPDRTAQRVAESPIDATFITVRGHQALLETGKSGLMLSWQEGHDVQVELNVASTDPTEIKQVAADLSLASPNDPRINAN